MTRRDLLGSTCRTVLGGGPDAAPLVWLIKGALRAAILDCLGRALPWPGVRLDPWEGEP